MRSTVLPAIPILCLILGLLLPACGAAPHKDEQGEWSEKVLENSPPRRDLLDACEWAVVNAGFPPGERDEARGTVTSGWDVHLQPFRNKGRRWQGILKVEVNEEGDTVLKSRVLAERNTTQDDTLDSGEAEWDPLADDLTRSRILLQHVLVQLHLD